MPPRAMATATISFGLVAIPVKLFTTTESGQSVSFRQLHEKCKTPLKRPYWCPKDEEMVGNDEIVKGYEYAKNQFVLFSDEELKKVDAEATKAIAIEEFVPLGEVDPVFFDRAYYLAPDKGGDRPYRLLSRVLQDLGLAGIAQYAVRGKEYLVLVRPVEDGLAMQQLRYAHEVRAFGDVPIEEGTEVKAAEIKLAKQLVEQSTSKTFDPSKYEDHVYNRMMEIIESKVEGEEITYGPGETPKAQVIDLMEALKASLGETAAAPRAKPKAKARKATTRKPPKASPRKAAKKTTKTRRKKASG